MCRIIPKIETIKRLRITKGLSLRDITDKGRVHYSTLSRIENGFCSVSPRISKIICDVLECDFNELFEIVESKRGETVNA